MAGLFCFWMTRAQQAAPLQIAPVRALLAAPDLGLYEEFEIAKRLGNIVAGN